MHEVPQVMFTNNRPYTDTAASQSQVIFQMTCPISFQFRADRGTCWQDRGGFAWYGATAAMVPTHQFL